MDTHDEIAAWNIVAWCRRYDIARSTYYTLTDKPDVMRIGRRVLITREADEAWRARMLAKVKADTPA